MSVVKHSTITQDTNSLIILTQDTSSLTIRTQDTSSPIISTKDTRIKIDFSFRNNPVNDDSFIGVKEYCNISRHVNKNL